MNSNSHGNDGAAPSKNMRNMKEEKKVVMVMGATGSGKSRLAVDIGSHFPAAEVINADSMQVYRRLHVLTNKIPLSDQKGIPHHLLGTVDASVEFTARDFRDQAIPIIDDIISRGGLPLIVGGTNYYIQALVTPFLVDDVVEDMELCDINETQDAYDTFSDAYGRLKEIDPVSANRIHPNDHRKINRYLGLYKASGVLPSTLFQEKSAEKWGRADNFRYDCLFIWVDASPTVLDNYVNQRVDGMMDAGLLNEVYDIYSPAADYTKGLRQAIGVREFEDFFTHFFSREKISTSCQQRNDGVGSALAGNFSNADSVDEVLNYSEILESGDETLINLLAEAIDKLKANTRRLVRRQKRRLNRLNNFFGWNLYYIDATEAFLCRSEESWQELVVKPCVSLVHAFLNQSPEAASIVITDVNNHGTTDSRDLWTQYVCEACGNQILRGAHEWAQHKQGRSHRKRMQRLKKNSSSTGLLNQPSS